MADRKPRTPPVIMENVRILFRNFGGAPGKFNPAGGKRSFSVALDDETADRMTADGWNVKWLKPRPDDEDARPQAILEVVLRFDGNPPGRATMITSRGRTSLGPDEVAILDWAEITNVDLTINPFHWDVNGNTGLKAYVKSIFVTIYEDALELKYAEVPDSAQNSIPVEPDRFWADQG